MGMDYNTRDLQMKVAELLHEECPLPTCPKGDNCPMWKNYLTKSAFFLGKLMPKIVEHITIPTAQAERVKVAELIEAELVCCDLYEKLNSFDHKAYGLSDAEFRNLSARKVAQMLGLTYHAICHWGGYAAALARQKCPSGRGECQPEYWCPTVGEFESPCHGGFDVCCAKPELHQTVGVTP